MTNVIKKIAHGNQMYIVAGGGSAGDGMETVYLTQSQYDALTPAEKADTTKQYAIISSTSGSLDADVVNYDNTTSGATATDVQGALDEVFQSVSNGKELIADAITDKGVSTSATDSFSTMASNIGSIQTESISDKLFSSAINNGLNGNFYFSDYGNRSTLRLIDSDIKKGISIAQGRSGSTAGVGNTLYAYYDDNGNCVCNQVSSTAADIYNYPYGFYVDGEPNKIYFGTYNKGVISYFYYDIENDQFVSTGYTPLDNCHAFNNATFSNVSLVPHADSIHTGNLLYITPVVS